MKKFKKVHKAKGFISKNPVVFAALAGAFTGLAVTYLLETEHGRNLLGSLRNSLKGFAAGLGPSLQKEA